MRLWLPYVAKNSRTMSECPYCGDNGCPYCMPVKAARLEYAVVDPDTMESHPCTEEEYENAVPEYREKYYVPYD